MSCNPTAARPRTALTASWPWREAIDSRDGPSRRVRVIVDRSPCGGITASGLRNAEGIVTIDSFKSSSDADMSRVISRCRVFPCEKRFHCATSPFAYSAAWVKIICTPEQSAATSKNAAKGLLTGFRDVYALVQSRRRVQPMRWKACPQRTSAHPVAAGARAECDECKASLKITGKPCADSYWLNFKK